VYNNSKRKRGDRMNFGRWNLTTFDIETTGLSAIDNDFVCSVTRKRNANEINTTLQGLMNFMSQLSRWDTLVVTYNGENYQGGFDFPFLRTKAGLKGIQWSMDGLHHIDIYPLVKRYFNTSTNVTEPVPKSRLRASDVKKLAKANDVEYTTKPKTYKKLTKMKNVDWLDYEEDKTISSNDLQSVYQFFFDPYQQEEYIDGAKTKELIEQGKLDDVITHCRRDVQRTEMVAEKVLKLLPSDVVDKNINKL
jgi:hypothetical protein